MTTKRTHGPCTCGAGAMLTAHAEGRIALAEPSNVHHDAACPSLYPAQQEPDALTRLARIVRQMQEEQLQRRTDALAEQALALISEAREEQRKARNAALTHASKEADAEAAEWDAAAAHDGDAVSHEANAIRAAARRILALKDSEQ